MAKVNDKDNNHTIKSLQDLYISKKNEDIIKVLQEIFAEIKIANDLARLDIFNTIIGGRPVMEKMNVILSMYEDYITKSKKSFLSKYQEFYKESIGHRSPLSIAMYEICECTIAEVEELSQNEKFKSKLAYFEELQLKEVKDNIMSIIKTDGPNKENTDQLKKFYEMIGDGGAEAEIPIEKMQSYFHSSLSPLLSQMGIVVHDVVKACLFEIEKACLIYKRNYDKEIVRDESYVIPFSIKALSVINVQEGDELKHLVEIQGIASHLTSVANKTMEKPFLQSIVMKIILDHFTTFTANQP